MFRVGDTVRTRYRFFGKNRRGVVERIDGGYVYVRLNYRGVLIEAYQVELDKV